MCIESPKHPALQHAATAHSEPVARSGGIVEVPNISFGRRRRSIAPVALLILLLPAILIFSFSPTLAQEPDDADGRQLGPVFMLSLGGKLYDDLWPILELPPPDVRNPAFADLSASDHDTWRRRSMWSR